MLIELRRRWVLSSQTQSERKSKPCGVCKRKFYPFRSTEKVCSVTCAIAYAQDKLRKKHKQETAKMKREFLSKDRSHQLKLAQQEFNAYIRERDKGLPCISCGGTGNKMTAGHYRSVGAWPALRFSEDNCFGQCWYNCNSQKSGNIVEMRKGMVNRIGEERVQWIEGPHAEQHLTLEDIKDIRQYFKEKRHLLISARSGQ